MNESTLFGRLLARYEFRLDESGVSVRLHDRDDPQVRAIEVAFDPAQPDEVLWVHSYPNAPFSQIVYGAAAHLWLATFPVEGLPPTSRWIGYAEQETSRGIGYAEQETSRGIGGERGGASVPIDCADSPPTPNSGGEEGKKPRFAPPSLCPEDVRLRQALRAYREMRAMEDAAHLRAACRAEAQAKKAEMRARLWGLGRFFRNPFRRVSSP